MNGTSETEKASERRVRMRPGGLLAAGAVCLAAGLVAGWLLFGRPEPVRTTSGTDLADADSRVELRRLAESVSELSEAVRSLAARTDTAPLAPREAARRPPPIAPGVKFEDTFETGTDGWFVARFAPQIVGKISRTEEEGRAKEGKGALALSYELAPGKIPLAVRMAKGINRLSLWIRTLNRPAEVVVGVHEKDESDYQIVIHVEPGEGWKHFDFDLATFQLGDDSEDENGGLDFDQINSVAVIDVSGFLGGEGENTLLMDNVVGEYRRAQEANGERF